MRLGYALVFVVLSIPLSYALLSCNAVASCSDVAIFRMANLSNAHSEKNDQTNYQNIICCHDTEGGNLSTSCGGSNYYKIFGLSNGSNAHADLLNTPGFDNPVCINSDRGYLDCAYQDNCSAYDTCVASISSAELGRSTSLHLASCESDPYDTKICCSVAAGETVTFAMEAALSDPADDSAEPLGYFKSGDLKHYYACIVNVVNSDKPTLGVMSAGSKVYYMNVSKPYAYRIEMKQRFHGNKFIIPVTKGGCAVVVSRLSDIDSFGIMTKSFTNATMTRMYPTEILLAYSGVDIVGDFSRAGAFDLLLERNQSGLSQIIASPI
jgi:hypothetical protein